VELVAAFVAKNDLDVLGLVHVDVVVGVDGYRWG